jgi:hypothetical protein
MTRTVRQIRRTGRRQPMAPVAWTTVPEVDTRIALIQARIPVGLEAFHAELHCRTRSALSNGHKRRARQEGPRPRLDRDRTRVARVAGLVDQ